MYVGRNFDPSDPGEDEVYAFDFSRDLPAGETIVATQWTCTAVEGSDAAASSRLSGAAQFEGTVSKQRVADLQPGVRYLLQAFVTTSGGSEISLYSHVQCKAPS